MVTLELDVKPEDCEDVVNHVTALLKTLSIKGEISIHIRAGETVMFTNFVRKTAQGDNYAVPIKQKARRELGLKEGDFVMVRMRKVG